MYEWPIQGYQLCDLNCQIDLLDLSNDINFNQFLKVYYFGHEITKVGNTWPINGIGSAGPQKSLENFKSFQYFWINLIIPNTNNATNMVTATLAMM